MEPLKSFEEIVLDYAKRRLNTEIPCSTNEHIFLAQKELIETATGKIRIFGYDLPEIFYFKNIASPVEVILINSNLIPNIQNARRNVENLDLYFLKMDTYKKLDRKNLLHEFMITEPTATYHGSFKLNPNKLISAIINFNDIKWFNVLNRQFEALKTNHSIYSPTKLAMAS